MCVRSRELCVEAGLRLWAPGWTLHLDKYRPAGGTPNAYSLARRDKASWQRRWRIKDAFVRFARPGRFRAGNRMGSWAYLAASKRRLDLD